MTPFPARAAMIMVITGLALCGCGTLPEDRAASGAAIGGAGGAIVGAVTSAAMLPALAIGAAIGGVAGLITDPDQIDLGAPPWRSQGAGPAKGVVASSPTPPAPRRPREQQAANDAAATASTDDVRVIQRNLNALGYRPGPTDGIAGPRTRAAVRAYQGTHHLRVDGEATTALARDIEDEIERLRQLTRAKDDETAAR